MKMGSVTAPFLGGIEIVFHLPHVTQLSSNRAAISIRAVMLRIPVPADQPPIRSLGRGVEGWRGGAGVCGLWPEVHVAHVITC